MDTEFDAIAGRVYDNQSTEGRDAESFDEYIAGVEHTHATTMVQGGRDITAVRGWKVRGSVGHLIWYKLVTPL